MRGRAFLGAFIALCLIAGCSSSSSDDAALREALDRIESLEEELETKATTTTPSTTAAPATTTTPPTTTSTTTTTTTIPTYDLRGMIKALDDSVYRHLIDNPVAAKYTDGMFYGESDWEKVLFYSGRPNQLEVEICINGYLDGYVEWVFEELFEDLGLSKTLHIKILRDRTSDKNQTFEEWQRGFRIEWLTEKSGQRNCTIDVIGNVTIVPWSTRIWITYEG